MATPARLVAASAVAALAFALVGCTPGVEEALPMPTTPVVQLGAPGQPNRTLSPEEVAALDSPEKTEADVTFVRHMLEHHAQAIVMIGYVEDRSDDDDIRLLAERMRLSQEAESDQFAAWLQDNGELLRDPDAEHAHTAAAPMPGMLTDAELAELEAAEGDGFDRLFLTSMTKHHEGAIVMVEELRAAGGGNEVDIDTIAKHIEADQQIEITRMQTMLAERS
ncbi:DUF305 domain-containing protein [Agromyces seonyuensis]|uniref:DUF305 domain-containing protein n=1 Tax=Agromyces seonyuensis TaxID=2662446 RepID=A0A6I4NZJ8_9MICO|nr:DUF305 domain-containing protein [Agromyces seonyuensis]MWB97189.1 DUF305 domain-containing protein [Agromyces seonyuensis]